MRHLKTVFAVTGFTILAIGLDVRSTNADTGIIDNLVGRVCSVDAGGGNTGYVLVDEVQPTLDEFGNENGHSISGDLHLATAKGDAIIIEDHLLGYVIIEDHIMLFHARDEEILLHVPGGEFVLRDVFAEPVAIRGDQSQGGQTAGFIIVEDVIMMYGQSGEVTGRALVGDVTLTVGSETIIIQDEILGSIVIQDDILYLHSDNEEVLRRHSSGTFIIEDEIDGI